MTHAIEALSSELAAIQKYVDAVVEGKVDPSREVGIAISEALNAYSKRLARTIKLALIHQNFDAI